MIIGFTITNFKGHEDDAIKFIRRKCILEDPSIAENIIRAGVGINIYSTAITADELESLPFDCTPIELNEGDVLLVSIVNFNLELFYNGKILRLFPTEYLRINKNEENQFYEYARQGLVKILHGKKADERVWILATGRWNSKGVWINNARWRFYGQ